MSALSHLDNLEAEAIYIIREVAAECEKPVMLYSIGKDSSVMLHLALKAFYPEKPPFPFLHVNTTWKFKEMIRFRDETMKKYGLQLIEHINQEGVKQGVNPFDYGASYTDIMKTQALKQALNQYGFTAAFGGGRRDEEKSRAKERIFSFRNEAQGDRGGCAGDADHVVVLGHPEAMIAVPFGMPGEIASVQQRIARRGPFDDRGEIKHGQFHGCYLGAAAARRNG